MTPLTVTPEEAAQRLGCGRTQVYELIKTGKLRIVPGLKPTKIPVAALEEFVNGGAAA